MFRIVLPHHWQFLGNAVMFRILSTQEKIYQELTPALTQKAQKNSIEREGMRKANLRDSVAVIQLYAKIENDIKNGTNWTIHSAGKESTDIRRNLDYFQEPSFEYLSGVGYTSAHLFDSAVNRNLTNDEIFLQDSGGQYLDGTTDVTRVFHYGTPTLHEKEIYTRVLMGHLNLAMLKFPRGHTGHDIDNVARAPIWSVGMDYPHESGHGVSAYGAVVEGPARISSVEACYNTDVNPDRDMFDSEIDPQDLYRVPGLSLYPLVEHMCFSNEPGIYEEGKFGVRIENVVMTRIVSDQSNGTGPDLLEFETLTHVPYEPHLILYDMLSPEQVQWINNYNMKIWSEISPILKQSGDMVAYRWLEQRVHAIRVNQNNIGCKNSNT